jgi:hypothetical protein
MASAKAAHAEAIAAMSLFMILPLSRSGLELAVQERRRSG